MKRAETNQTSTGEMVTISRAEYEKLQAQSQRISELEQQVAVLMEAIRLARHKQFGASSPTFSPTTKAKKVSGSSGSGWLSVKWKHRKER